MSITASNTGELQLLKYMLGHDTVSGGGHRIRLFYNNATPVAYSTQFSQIQAPIGTPDAPNQTVIAEIATGLATSYSAQTLSSTNWSFTTPVYNTPTTIIATYGSTITFTLNNVANLNIYGYYITDNTNNNLIWAERFAGAPFQIPNTGGSISIIPTITLI